MCTHVSILITISIIFTQSVCMHVHTGFKAVTPLSQCMSSSHQNLIIFHGYQYLFIIFAQSVCTHVRTGFKAVTPLPECMSYSIVRRKVLRMFKLPTKSLVEGYDNPSGESIFPTKKRSPQTSSYVNP